MYHNFESISGTTINNSSVVTGAINNGTNIRGLVRTRPNLLDYPNSFSLRVGFVNILSASPDFIPFLCDIVMCGEPGSTLLNLFDVSVKNISLTQNASILSFALNSLK